MRDTSRHQRLENELDKIIRSEITDRFSGKRNPGLSRGNLGYKGKKVIVMNIEKSYITDEKGNIRSVIIDYETYKMIEDTLLDQGLLKAMEQIADEDTLDYEDVREVISQL